MTPAPREPTSERAAVVDGGGGGGAARDVGAVPSPADPVEHRQGRRMSLRRGPQEVRIFNIQDRSSRPEARKPRVVRWRVDGREHSQAFRTKAEADRFRSRLLVAQQEGEQFDRVTGRPLSWSPQGKDIRLHVWARHWVADQWAEWQPRTRREDVYSLSRFLPLMCSVGAKPRPAGMRKYLCETLQPGAEIDPEHPCERWLTRWVLPLGDLNRATLAEVDGVLGIGDAGQPLASETARRYR